MVRIEADTRRVVIGTREDLARRELTASGANWLVAWNEGKGKREEGREKRDDGVAIGNASFQKVDTTLPPPLSLHSSPFSLRPIRAQVKIRYRSRPADATVEPLPGERFRVRFDEPCFGVAPGQAAVCYDGDRVLGGGWID